MAKIIKFDSNRRRHEQVEPTVSCDHKDVIAFTAGRTVQCAICGTKLDPFDVMLELLKGYLPPIDNNRELKLFTKETDRRRHETHTELKK